MPTSTSAATSPHSVKTALVGYGLAGRVFHLPLLKAAADIDLRAVVSGDAEKRRSLAAAGLNAVEDFGQVLADAEIELVVLATPHSTHRAMAEAALKAGKHVVVDKPMALTLDDARAMATTAEAAGRQLITFHNRRWDSDYLTLQRLIAAGRIGRITWAELAWTRYGGPRGWRVDLSEGYGRLHDLGSHLVDQLLQLIEGPVATVSCRMREDFAESQVPSHCRVEVVFESGAVGVIEVTAAAHSPKPRWWVVGTEGTFAKTGLDRQEDSLRAGRPAAAAATEFPEPAEDWPRLSSVEGTVVKTVVVPPGRGEWEAFYPAVARMIRNGEPSPVPVGETLRVIAVLDAAILSAQTGEPVVPEIV